jgi:hypothetical protein
MKITVYWKKVIKLSKEPFAFFVMLEGEGNSLLWTCFNSPPHYTATHPRRQQSSWEPPVSQRLKEFDIQFITRTSGPKEEDVTRRYREQVMRSPYEIEVLTACLLRLLFPGCDTMWSGRYWSTFRGTLILPYSGLFYLQDGGMRWLRNVCLPNHSDPRHSSSG